MVDIVGRGLLFAGSAAIAAALIERGNVAWSLAWGAAAVLNWAVLWLYLGREGGE